MALKVGWLVIDAADMGALASFWAQALDYEIITGQQSLDPIELGALDKRDSEDEVGIRPRDRNGLHILFEKVDDAKSTKNRLHLDLRPDDQKEEVRRLKDIGASEVDVGQGDEVTWVVMADPEDNEFCVLRALQPGEEGP